MTTDNVLEEKIIAAVNTYIGAFEKDDLEAIMALYSDDCTVEDPVGSPVKKGKQKVREFYQGALGMGVKLALQSEVRVAGNEAAFAFSGQMDTAEGTMTFRPIDVMKFNDEGKIVAMRAFFGSANMGMQTV